jgi:hypothetical protein
MGATWFRRGAEAADSTPRALHPPRKKGEENKKANDNVELALAA